MMDLLHMELKLFMCGVAVMIIAATLVSILKDDKYGED